MKTSLSLVAALATCSLLSSFPSLQAQVTKEQENLNAVPKPVWAEALTTCKTQIESAAAKNPTAKGSLEPRTMGMLGAFLLDLSQERLDDLVAFHEEQKDPETARLTRCLGDLALKKHAEADVLTPEVKFVCKEQIDATVQKDRVFADNREATIKMVVHTMFFRATSQSLPDMVKDLAGEPPEFQAFGRCTADLALKRRDSIRSGSSDPASTVQLPVAAPPPAPSRVPATGAAVVDVGLVEITFWNSIKEDRSPEGFQLYLQRYPRGQFVDIARLRIEQLTARPAPTASATAVSPVSAGVAATSAVDTRSRAAGTVGAHPLDQQNYVWIPAGSFQMGCSTADRECNAAENPSHLVRISSGFWIGQTEVTVEALWKFVATSAGRSAGPVDSGSARLPAVSVTWDEAQAYCKWIGGQLPTEAEWEYAARAGTVTSRYGDVREIAWFKDNSGNRVHEVGQKKSNAWGVQDMLGNLWEWVGDWYAPDYYRPAAVSDPTGPATGRERVVRGGSWDNTMGLLRVSLRLGNDPSSSSANNGFRCALKVLP